MRHKSKSFCANLLYIAKVVIEGSKIDGGKTDPNTSIIRKKPFSSSGFEVLLMLATFTKVALAAFNVLIELSSFVKTI